jgi:hypothetical protein
MSKKKAAEYITMLSRDPKARAEHKKDPEAAMTKAGVAPTEREVIKRGNADEIRKHLGDDAPPGCFLLMF